MNPPPWWLNSIACLLVGLGFGYVLTNETVESPNILIKEKVVEIPCETIKVYPTKKAKKLAKLPKKVRKDPNLHLTASTHIPEDGHSHVVSAVYAKHDGSVRLFDYKEPLKLFSKPRDQYTLGISYGASDLETTYQASLNLDLMRVKKAKLGLVGTVRGDGSYFTGVGLSYSW